MVYLGGPRGRRGRGGRAALYLHDPPPGYRPPRRRLPLKERQRNLRVDWIVLRVATVVVVPLVIALFVIIVLMVATHG
jgi:hypothetical protein